MNMLKMADGVFAHDRRVYDRWGETDPAIKAALARLAADLKVKNSSARVMVTDLARTLPEHQRLYNSQRPPASYHLTGRAADVSLRDLGVDPDLAVSILNTYHGIEAFIDPNHQMKGRHIHLEVSGRQMVARVAAGRDSGHATTVSVIEPHEPSTEFQTIRERPAGRPPSSLPPHLGESKPGATQIGDTWLSVPPQHIAVNTTQANYAFPGLRTDGTPKIMTGTQAFRIEMTVEFPTAELINAEFRHILAQFKRTPFTTIKNELVSKSIAPIAGTPASSRSLTDPGTSTVSPQLVVTREYRAIPVVLYQLTVSTIPNAPDSLQTTMTFLLFNHLPYSTDFSFVQTLDEAIQQAGRIVDARDRTIRDAGTPAGVSVGESSLYRRFYYGLLPEWNGVTDGTYFGVEDDAPSSPFTPPTHREKQLDLYLPEGNASLSVEYTFTEDTIKDRIARHHESMHRQLQALQVLGSDVRHNRTQSVSGRQTISVFAVNPSVKTGTPTIRRAGETVTVVDRGTSHDQVRFPDQVLGWVSHQELIPAEGAQPDVTPGSVGQTLFIRELRDALSFPFLAKDIFLNNIKGFFTNVGVAARNLGLPVTDVETTVQNLNTGEILTIEDRITQLLNTQQLPVLKDAVQHLADAYRAAIDATFPTRTITDRMTIGGPLGAGRYNESEIEGHAVLTGISCQYTNPVVEVPLLQYTIPTYQHVRTGEFESCSVALQTDSLELIGRLRVMQSLLTHTTLVNETSNPNVKSYLDARLALSDLSVGHLLRVLGLKHLVIQQMSVDNIDGQPGWYSITLILQQADLLVFEAEQLIGTKTVTPELINAAFEHLIPWVTYLIRQIQKSGTAGDGTTAVTARQMNQIPEPGSEKPAGTFPSGLWGTLAQDLASQAVLDLRVTRVTERRERAFLETIASSPLRHLLVSGPTPLGQIESELAIKAYQVAVKTLTGKSVTINPLAKVTEEVIGVIALQRRVDETMRAHSTRVQVSRLLESDETRPQLGSPVLDDLWTRNQERLNRRFGGVERAADTCYPDLDLPVLRFSNLDTLPGFYLHDSPVLKSSSLARAKETLRGMTDLVFQAAVVNRVITLSRLEELETTLLSQGSTVPVQVTLDFKGTPVTITKPAAESLDSIQASIDNYLNGARAAPTTSRRQLKQAAQDLLAIKILTFQAALSHTMNRVDVPTSQTPTGLQSDLLKQLSLTDRDAFLSFLGAAEKQPGAKSENLQRLRAFAGTAFGQVKEGAVGDLVGKDLRQTIQELLENYQQLDLLGDDISPLVKWWGIESVSDQQRKVDVLRQLEETILSDRTGQMIRAYPTFKLYFIEEDAPQWLLFDDYYSYSAIKEISIIKSKQAASDVAVIKLSNISGILTDPRSIRDTETNILGNDTTEQIVQSLYLRPGLSVAIRLGYGTHPMDLEPVFLGTIVEIAPGEDIEVVCQGWGVELYNPVGVGDGISIGWKSFQKAHGDVATRILSELDGLDHFGRWSLYNEQDPVRLSGMRRWSETILSFLGADTLAGAVGKTNHLDQNIYLAYSDSLNPFHNVTFDWRIYNQTAWDALNELCLFHPNYVVRPLPFNAWSSPNFTDQRMTLYIGPKDGFYRFTDDRRVTNTRGQTADAYDRAIMDGNDPDLDEELGIAAGIAGMIRKLVQDENPRGVNAFLAGLEAMGFHRLVRLITYTRLVYAQDRTKKISLLDLVLPEKAIEGPSTLTDLGQIAGLFSPPPSPGDFLRAASLIEGGYRVPAGVKAIPKLTIRGVPPAPEILEHFAARFRELAITEARRDLPAVWKKDLVDQEKTYKEGSEQHARGYFANHPHYRPFRNHHMASSYFHIVKNEIVADAEGLSNEVIMTFPNSEPVMSDPREGRSAITQAVAATITTQTRTFRAVLDDDIKAEFRRPYQTFQKNVDTNWWDELVSFTTAKKAAGTPHAKGTSSPLMIPSYIRVANTILANQLQGMYTGELTLLGNASVKPYDVVWVQDDYHEMHGPVEVETVVHRLSSETGFTTTITPCLMTYQQSYRSVLDAHYLGFAFWDGVWDAVWAGLGGLGTSLALLSVAKWAVPKVAGGLADVSSRLSGRLAQEAVDVGAQSPKTAQILLKTGERIAGSSQFLLRHGTSVGSFIGKAYWPIAIALSLNSARHALFDTWVGHLGRMWGNNIISFSGLWLRGAPYVAGIDGFRKNTLLQHRLASRNLLNDTKGNIIDLLLPLGDIPGNEPGLTSR